MRKGGCSQNRQGQGASKLTSLKESGDLEYAADTVMFLVANEKRAVVSPARAVDLMVKKNRFGDQGVIPLTFFPAAGTFREVDRWAPIYFTRTVMEAHDPQEQAPGVG